MFWGDNPTIITLFLIPPRIMQTDRTLFLGCFLLFIGRFSGKMSPLAQVAINGFAWIDHAMAYSRVGSPPTEALHPIGDAARRPIALRCLSRSRGAPRCVRSTGQGPCPGQLVQLTDNP